MLPLNLFDQQRRNRRRTVLFLLGFVLFLAFLGLGADVFLYGAGGSPGLPVFTLGALAFGGLSAWWSLHEGDKAVLRGKCWPKGDPEPADWMIVGEDHTPNVMGSPGLFGNAKEVELIYDNLTVKRNESSSPPSTAGAQ